MTIWICDDHALLRAGLVELLSREFPSAQFREFGVATDLLLEWKAPPDLLLLDLHLGGDSDGVPLLEHLAATAASRPILVVTMHGTRQTLDLCRSAGARGFVSKAVAASVLIEVAKALLAGGSRFVDPDTGERMDFREIPPKHLQHLSDREYLLLKALRAGRTLQSVADEIGISHSAASSYKRRLCVKLGARNNAELFQLIAQGAGEAM